MYSSKMTLLAACSVLFAGVHIAQAVVVQIDIESSGEPVPGTTITFETTEGEPVSEDDITLLTDDTEIPALFETATESDEPLSDPDSQTGTELVDDNPQIETETADTPAPQDSTAALTPPESEVTDDGDAGEGTHQFVYASELAGTELVLVVRKDDRVVKREPITLQENPEPVRLEAFDPADATLSVLLSQPQQCARRRSCGYEANVTNNGSGIYEGPVFLLATLNGTIGPEGAGEWTCKAAGRGKFLCFADIVLEPGETMTFPINAILNRRIPRSASSCVVLFRPDGPKDGKRSPLLRTVQLALATKGFNAGTADGISGPRTNRAIGKYREGLDIDDQLPLEGLFSHLYGVELAHASGPNIEDSDACVELDLKPVPVAARTPPTSKQSPQKSPEKTEEKPKARVPAFSIGIGVGIGGFNDRRRPKRKHRPRYEE